MNAPRRTLMAPDRVRLYLSLVPYLAERGQVSVHEAADDFGVSPATMRAMVQKLTVIGLPGEDGFWQLDQDLFNINWDLLDADDVIELTNTVALHRAPRLTSREAAALLSGLRIVRTIPGVDETGAVTNLVDKLTRGASTTPAEVVVAPPAADHVRAAVAEAMRRGTALSFTYRAPDMPETSRTVDPVRVQITDGEWYLQGWCHLRRAMRTFNLVRMSDPVVTETVAEHGGDPAREGFGGGDAAEIATVRFAADLAPLVGDFLTGAEQHTENGMTTAEIPLGDARAIKRLAARRGGAVEVIGPESARAATRAWAQAALELYPELAEPSDHPSSGGDPR